ncbi:MAG: dipeptide/oligopeptide/nickel ABC transporter permease/ATP-binding protein [Nitratireductor sp.]|nr:dipeptide/oligopeptide/nickel ABC transporter permease/ATP-binding protein [Nitratireductor sp.]
MSTTADLTGADVGAAGGRAGRILGAVPVWMVLAVAFFLIVGIAGIVLMTVPDLSKLVYRQSLSKAFAPPFTKGTLLGADQLGRAIEYRLLAGLGISLVSAAVVTMMATVIGLAMGLFAGLFGRTADRLVTIIIDVTWAYPTILLAVVVAGIQGPGVSTVILALGLTLWAALARIVRGQVLMLREQEYVLAARALGYGRFYIAFRHMLPNLLPICILMATLFVALTIIAEAGLSFIGLGAQSPTPSLGKTLAEGFSFASSSPWPLLFGSITIIGLVTTLNAFGDHLRDVLDPKGVVPSAGRMLRSLTRLPGPAVEPSGEKAEFAVSAQDVSVSIVRPGGNVPAVTGLSLGVRQGQTLGIVGESGSGKSVAARALVGLLPAGLALESGRVLWNGRDIATYSAEQLRQHRGRFIALVFQDARASMDPLYTVGDQIVETLLAHFPQDRRSARGKALEMLARVGLNDPAVFFDRYPHQLSGGQMQRAALAAVLVLGPKVLIADEPTTGLDATTQKKIVELVAQLQREMDMTVIWISHDLDLVGQIADNIAVMYAGQVVETGNATTVLTSPTHPYTRGLIDSRPHIGHAPKTPLASIGGSVPEPGGWPPACRFQPRCERSLAQCASLAPQLAATERNGVLLRCHNPIESAPKDAT